MNGQDSQTSRAGLQRFYENPLPLRLAIRSRRRPTCLKDHGHTVINPKLPDDDFTEAVRIAQAEFERHWPQAVVGSSRGGAVAMNIESGGVIFVVHCPAWKK